MQLDAVPLFPALYRRLNTDASQVEGSSNRSSKEINQRHAYCFDMLQDAGFWEGQSPLSWPADRDTKRWTPACTHTKKVEEGRKQTRGCMRGENCWGRSVRHGPWLSHKATQPLRLCRTPTGGLFTWQGRRTASTGSCPCRGSGDRDPVPREGVH